MTWLDELGVQIRTARENSDLTQQELAKSLRIWRAQLSNYETGKSAPTVNVATEIAEALQAAFMGRVHLLQTDSHDHRPIAKRSPFRITFRMMSEPCPNVTCCASC